jgi:hypothetical protein
VVGAKATSGTSAAIQQSAEMDSKVSNALSGLTPPVPRIERWLTIDEIENLPEVRIDAALRVAAERRELQRAQRLYAELCRGAAEPPARPRSDEWCVYRTLLYANSRHRLRLSRLVRLSGLPRERLLAAVRRLREQGYLRFGVEKR